MSNNEFIPNFEKIVRPFKIMNETALNPGAPFTPPVPVVPEINLDPEPFKKDFLQYEPETQQLLEDVKNLEITDENTFNIMAEYGARCGLILNRIEKARKVIVEKPKAFTSRIDEFSRIMKKNPDAGKKLSMNRTPLH